MAKAMVSFVSSTGKCPFEDGDRKKTYKMLIESFYE